MGVPLRAGGPLARRCQHRHPADVHRHPQAGVGTGSQLWGEDSVGTNGIGTIAEIGRAQMVVGPEHFADALVSFACVGAPIHSPTTHRLEGIITLSLRADAANALLTPLMVSTAADIEHRLLMAATLDERRVLDAYLAAKRQHRLVAAVGKDLLIAGAKVTRLLDQLVDRDVLWDVVSQVVSSTGPARRLLATRNGDELALVCTSIYGGDRLIGALVDVEGSLDKPTTHARRCRGTKVRRWHLPGDNSKWVGALDVAALHAAEANSVVLVGGAGVGKWSIVREMTGPSFDAETTAVIDCAELIESTAPSGTLVCSAVPLVVLIRHVDAANDRVLRELGAQIEHWRAAGARPWIVMTLRSNDGQLTAEQNAFFERCNATTLPIPGLAERQDDIPLIVAALLARHPRAGKVHLSLDAIGELTRASWPGNLRQLETVVGSLASSRLGEVAAADLPFEVRARSVRRSLSPIDQVECEAIMKALDAADGNKVVAARLIGLSRSTIYRKIRAYGLDRDAAFF